MLALSVLTLGAVSELRAQRPIVRHVADAVSCQRCAIRIDELFTAKNSDDIRLPNIPAAVVVDRAGRYWVVAGSITVLGANGKPIRRIEHGRDPLVRLDHAFDAAIVGDSVIVFDAVDGFAVVFGPNLMPVRDIPFTIGVNRILVRRWPDDLVGSGTLLTAESAGLPLHRISIRSDGASITSSFGPGDGELRPGHFGAVSERLVEGSFGRIWSFRRGEYVLTSWDGAITRPGAIFSRRPSWFPGALEPSIGGPRRAPTPSITALQVDTAGLLWVFIARPAKSWPSAWPAVGSGLREVPLDAIAFEKLYRTTIEVIDPKTAVVVTRMNTDRLIVEALPNRLAVTYSVDASGRRQISVVSLSLD